jgi:imidazolonepropionase-like amidohydrolase
MRTIFTNARILDDGRLSSRLGTVVVEGNCITGVGFDEASEKHSGDRHYDLAGKTLMPGMTIGHWHSDYPNTRLETINTIYLGQGMPPPYLAALSAKNLRNALLAGFTAVVGAGCSNDNDASLKMAIADGVVEGPYIVAAGHHINTTGSDGDRAKWWYDLRPSYSNGITIAGGELFCDGIDAFRQAVREEIRRGVEIIKIIPTGGHGLPISEGSRQFSRDEMRAIVETAHDRGARVRAHVAGADAILECVEIGVDILDHCDGLDERAIEAMAKAGTFMVPSMLFLKTLTDERLKLPAQFTDPARKDYEEMIRMLPAAHAAGIRMVPGDDYGFAIMPHTRGGYAEHLAIYTREIGISAEDVLKWVTVYGAAMTLREKTHGRIRAGYAADLLVVDGDPTADIGLLSDPDLHLKLIMIGGRAVKDTIAAVDVRSQSSKLLKSSLVA